MFLKLSNLSGSNISELEASDDIYGIKEINKIIISQVIRWQLHKKAGFNSYCKTRSEIKGSGKKIYRQKGTGNARHSDRYAPQFKKGGVAHGPKGVQWSMKVPKKVRSLALKHSLSAKVMSSSLIVFDSLEMSKPKTKDIISNFKNYLGKKVLFIDNQLNSSNFVKSISNVVDFNYLHVNGLNVYDLIRADYIFISKSAFGTIEKRLLS